MNKEIFIESSADIEKLPFKEDALKGFLTKEQVQLHFQKDNVEMWKCFQQMIKVSPLRDLKVNRLMFETVIQNADGCLYDAAAQLYNTCLYWKCVAPCESNKGGSKCEPTGRIKELLTSSFGSVDMFTQHFVGVSESMFGPGWCFLVLNPSTMCLSIVSLKEAGCPIRGSMGIPLVACCLWEHAWVLDYKNSRKEFVETFCKWINWEFVNEWLEVYIQRFQKVKHIMG
jgi:Fe-Mn family superoxide dismutase